MARDKQRDNHLLFDLAKSAPTLHNAVTLYCGSLIVSINSSLDFALFNSLQATSQRNILEPSKVPSTPLWPSAGHRDTYFTPLGCLVALTAQI